MRKFAIVEENKEFTTKMGTQGKMLKQGSMIKANETLAELTEEEIKCKYRLCNHHLGLPAMMCSYEKEVREHAKNVDNFDNKLKKVIE